MGGGDLNLKKSWHPHTMKNQERVWKAEQQKAAEDRKMAELQRELKEERERELLQRTAEQSGAVEKKKDAKLDWMYKGPGGHVSREEYLLGRKIDTAFDLLQKSETEEKNSNDNEETSMQNKPVYTIEHEINPESVVRRNSDNLQVDMRRKLLEDPLLLIRQREEQTKREITSNPVKMKQLQQLISTIKSKKGKKKKKKKKKKKYSKHATSSSSSDSDSDDDGRRKKKKNKIRKKAKSSSSSSDSSSTSSSSSSSSSEDRKKKKMKKNKSNKHKEERGKKLKNNAREENMDFKRHDRTFDERIDRYGDNLQRNSDPYQPEEYNHDGRENKWNRGRESERREQRHNEKNRLRENSEDGFQDERRNKHFDWRNQDRFGGGRNQGRFGRGRNQGRFGGGRNLGRNWGGSNQDRYVEGRHGHPRAYNRSPSQSRSRSQSRERSRYGEGSRGSDSHDKSRQKLSESKMERMRQEMMDAARKRDQDRKENVKRYEEERRREEEMEKDVEKFRRSHLLHASKGSIEDRVKSRVSSLQRGSSHMETNFARK